MLPMTRGRVYQTCATRSGMAAIPLNQHDHPVFERDPDGIPLCPRGLRMHPTYQFQHTNGYRAQRYRCPLLFPEPTQETCDHPQFRPRERLCQRYQPGSRWPDAHDPGSRESPLSRHLHPAHLLPAVSTVKPRTWASNDPKHATSAPFALSTP